MGNLSAFTICEFYLLIFMQVYKLLIYLPLQNIKED